MVYGITSASPDPCHHYNGARYGCYVECYHITIFLLIFGVLFGTSVLYAIVVADFVLLVWPVTFRGFIEIHLKRPMLGVLNVLVVINLLEHVGE